MIFPDPSDDADNSKDTGDRFRNILSASQTVKTNSTSLPDDSPLGKLPRLTARVSSGARGDIKSTTDEVKKTSGMKLFLPTGVKLSRVGFQSEKVLPAFWTIASALSVFVNIILIAVVLYLLGKVSSAQKIGSGVLGGLYHNFEQMDAAHIRTVIPIQTEVPVRFDLQVSQETEVVLSRDVTIQSARVTLQTGGLNILSAPTNIILPAGTSLPIYLNINVPVETTVPIVMDVNVDIPLETTDLHQPFTGLQDIIKPFYCLVSPDATSNGEPICIQP
ncbi:MAG: hypothetical protein JXA13_13080 [Anaerolineales bacterium]|nr:hypothetical protein [Anaerolineales bacterium]